MASIIVLPTISTKPPLLPRSREGRLNLGHAIIHRRKLKLSASATKGFGSEVIGRETGYVDEIIHLFGHVPVLSHLAYILVKMAGLENEADEWVPKFTMVLLAFSIPLLGFLIRLIIHVTMVATRILTKGTGANARFATFLEVFREYSIPSRFSSILFSYISGLALPLAILVMLGVRINRYLLLAIGLALGTLIRFWKGPYPEIRKKAQPFPLGNYKMLRVYLIGGYKLSFLRGKVKERRENHLIVLGPTGSGKTTK